MEPSRSGTRGGTPEVSSPSVNIFIDRRNISLVRGEAFVTLCIEAFYLYRVDVPGEKRLAVSVPLAPEGNSNTKADSYYEYTMSANSRELSLLLQTNLEDGKYLDGYLDLRAGCTYQTPVHVTNPRGEFGVTFPTARIELYGLGRIQNGEGDLQLYSHVLNRIPGVTSVYMLEQFVLGTNILRANTDPR